MTKDELVGLFEGSDHLKKFRESLRDDEAKLRLRGVSGSAYAFLAADVIKNTNDHHLFVLSDKEAAAYFLSDL